MYTEKDKIKMRGFIQRLMSNPVFKDEPKLVIEDNITQFFIQNSTALKATFASPEYFPSLSWSDIQCLFSETLIREINLILTPDIQNLVHSKIDIQVINMILNRQIASQNLKEELINFISKLLSRVEIRKNMDTVFRIIDYKVIDRYINEVFDKKAYISHEFSIVERLKLPPNILANFIKLVMLIGLISYIRLDNVENNLFYEPDKHKLSLGSIASQKAHYEKAIRQFIANQSIFTEDLIKKSAQLLINFNDDKSLPATSRIANIFFGLGKNYKPKTKVEKGADTYDKSWFQVQKKNYRYFGYDIDMLNELYCIASENRW